MVQAAVEALPFGNCQRSLGHCARLVKLLNRYTVWPECSVCDRSLGFDGHVPAHKLVKCLAEKLPTGMIVATLANDFRQAWKVPGGAVLFLRN